MERQQHRNRIDTGRDGKEKGREEREREEGILKEGRGATGRSKVLQALRPNRDSRLAAGWAVTKATRGREKKNSQALPTSPDYPSYYFTDTLLLVMVTL